MTRSRSHTQPVSRELLLWRARHEDILFRPAPPQRPAAAPGHLLSMITASVPRRPSLVPRASGPASAQLSKLCSQAVTQLNPGLSIGSWSFLYGMGLRFHSPALREAADTMEGAGGWSQTMQGSNPAGQEASPP